MPTTDLYGVVAFEPKYLRQCAKIEESTGGEWTETELLSRSTRGSTRFWLALNGEMRVGAFLIFREGRYTVEILNFAGNNPARRALWTYLTAKYLRGRTVVWRCIGGPSEDRT